MIEKFTPEEIEILKKELAEMPKDYQKRTLCEESLRRYHRIFKDRPKYSGVDHYEIENAIFNIADHTFANYEERDKFHKKNGKYRRAIFVKNKFALDYQHMVSEIMDIIQKYYNERITGDESN